jgi:hypothetical protein
MQYFPDLSEIVAEKRRIRRRWRRYKQFEDKVKLNRLTNLIHDKISIEKFEADVQEASDGGDIWKLTNKVKGRNS